MLFTKTLLVFTGLLSLGRSSYDTTASDKDLVQQLHTLTDLTAQADTLAQSISVTNFFSTTPQLINQQRQIVQVMTSDASQELVRRSLLIEIEISGPSARRKHSDSSNAQSTLADADVLDAFKTFSIAMKKMLATEIGKHGLISLTPFVQPLAQLLRTLEGGYDTLGFGVIDALKKGGDEAQKVKTETDAMLAQAMDVYSQ